MAHSAEKERPRISDLRSNLRVEKARNTMASMSMISFVTGAFLPPDDFFSRITRFQKVGAALFECNHLHDPGSGRGQGGGCAIAATGGDHLVFRNISIRRSDDSRREPAANF